MQIIFNNYINCLYFLQENIFFMSYIHNIFVTLLHFTFIIKIFLKYSDILFNFYLTFLFS